MKKKAKELEEKWKLKEQEVSGLETKINELQDQLERIQHSPAHHHPGHTVRASGQPPKGKGGQHSI